LPAELFILEIGVGSGTRCGLFIQKFRQLDKQRGTNYYQRLRVLMGDYSLETLDMSRPAAHLQLQSVANAHNIAFEEVPAAYLLPGLIAETRQKETVFVDTPGYSGADSKAAEAAAAAIAECPQLDVHLVVPGYMKARDLRLCIERYAPFGPTKLIVTKLDETQSFGSIFSEAARAGLQLSFVAYGPGIPNDIRPASYKDLLSMPAERAKARAQAVA